MGYPSSTGASHDVRRCPSVHPHHRYRTQPTLYLQSVCRCQSSHAMSHYLREHLDAVGELPQKLRETMTSIGLLDDRVQSISALIDSDIGEVARARQRYYAQFDSSNNSGDGDSGGEIQPPRTSRAKVCGTLQLLCNALYLNTAGRRSVRMFSIVFPNSLMFSIQILHRTHTHRALQGSFTTHTTAAG